jgi:thymidylate synthase
MSWDNADTLKLFVALFILYSVYWFYERLAAQKAKAAAEVRERDAEKAEAEAKQRQAAEIRREYMYIDEQTRHRLRTLVEERIQHLDLWVRPGDIEAAVVRMYKRSHSGTLS